MVSTTKVVRTRVDADEYALNTSPFSPVIRRSCRLSAAQVSPWEAALQARHSASAWLASPAMYSPANRTACLLLAGLTASAGETPADIAMSLIRWSRSAFGLFGGNPPTAQNSSDLMTLSACR